jgi:uncharacterized protein
MHVAALTLAVLAVAIPPSPSRWVEDHAAFLSPATRTALDGRLEGYQRSTGHQVIVWIGRSLEGAPLDEWAVQTFKAWKVGRKGFDDGIAMYVFAEERKIDIEVGYGLEDKVPDAITSRIIRDLMTPRLQAGDRDGAITAGVDALLASIEGKPWAGAPTSVPPTEEPWIEWIFGALAVVVFLILAIKHPRLAMMLLGSVLSGRHRSGGGRGGFGGGGGRSGGGGARGGW